MKMNVLLGAFALVGLAGGASAQLASTNLIPGTFIDITQPANNTGLHADDASVPFTATHGNKILSAGVINISSNGMIMSPVFNSFTNTTLPVAGEAGYFPYWDDLINSSQGNIFAVNLTDRTVVEWAGVALFSGGGLGTFEVQIFDDAGVIGTGPGGSKAQFLYQEVSQAGWANGSSATVGAQNSSSFTQYSFNTGTAPGVHNGEVISIFNIPAPSSLALLGLGGLIAGRRRR